MTCPRCHREMLDASALAAQADRVRALIAGAIDLAQGGPELEKSYGGDAGVRRALEQHLLRAEGLAFEHARAAACVAGTCLPPVANDCGDAR